MYYRYQPHPYYRRYYDLNPYNYYRRYYNPIIDSQIANVDQSIINYGDMNDVIQDADVYQSMTPAPEEDNNIESEIVIIKPQEVVEEETEPPTPSLLILP